MSNKRHRTNLAKIPKLVCLLLILCASVSIAQNTNPFEIKSRLKNSSKVEGKTTKLIDNSNPFEIKRRGNGAAEIVNTPNVKKKKTKRKGFSTTKESRKSFIFILMMTLLVLIAILFTLFREVVNRTWKAFLNEKMLNQLHREQGVLPDGPFMILYGLFFTTSGIFTFFLLDYLKVLPYEGNWINLYACIGSILAIFLFKHFLLTFVGWLFPIHIVSSTYNFSIVIFNIIIGLILVPFIVLLAYGPSDLLKILFYLAGGTIVCIFLFQQLRALFLSGKYLTANKFHFFLYLCTIEIAPVIVLIKLILLSQEA